MNERVNIVKKKGKTMVTSCDEMISCAEISCHVTFCEGGPLQ